MRVADPLRRQPALQGAHLLAARRARDQRHPARRAHLRREPPGAGATGGLPLTALLVVENTRRWPLQLDGAEVVSARDYLVGGDWGERRGLRVYNFCRTYGYQTLGYYVSLLAAARGHRPDPHRRDAAGSAPRPGRASRLRAARRARSSAISRRSRARASSSASTSGGTWPSATTRSPGRSTTSSRSRCCARASRGRRRALAARLGAPDRDQ